MKLNRATKTLLLGGAAVAIIASTATAAMASTAAAAPTVAAAPVAADSHRHDRDAVAVQVLSPRPGDHAGSGGAAWIVDLKITYPSITAAGFTGPQLTGPGVHANAAPFPGAFSPGRDDHLPGLVVLSSTTTSTITGFSGPGTNLANLFNVTAVTDHTSRATQIQDTWIVGAPIAGQNLDTVLTIAVVGDLNHDGIYNDAPAVITDVNHDGRIDARDLRAMGVAGDIQTVRFHLNGPLS